jgi:LPS export ABC transporter permease LptG
LLVPFLRHQFPAVAYYVIPVATLVSALVTIGLLAKQNEVTAMKACGISIYRIAAPLMAAGLLIGVGLLAIQERLLPEAVRRSEMIRDEIRGRPASGFRRLSRNWLIAKNGTLCHFGSVDPPRGVIRDLSIFELAPGEWRLARRVAVPEARFTDVPQSDLWRASHASAVEFTEDGAPSEVRYVSSVTLSLEPPSYFRTERPDADRMSYFELGRYIEDLRAGGTNVRPYVVAWYRKISFPFVTLVMTLLAIPFAATTGKTGAVHGIGLGAALAFLYWSAMSVFGALGNAGAMTPVLAAWAPNVLFGAGGLSLLLRTRT